MTDVLALQELAEDFIVDAPISTFSIAACH